MTLKIIPISCEVIHKINVSIRIHLLAGDIGIPYVKNILNMLKENKTTLLQLNGCTGRVGEIQRHQFDVNASTSNVKRIHLLFTFLLFINMYVKQINLFYLLVQ